MLESLESLNCLPVPVQGSHHQYGRLGGYGTVIIFRHTPRGIPAIWSPSRLTLAYETDRNSANAFSESPESAIWTRVSLSPTPRPGSYIRLSISAGSGQGGSWVSRHLTTKTGCKRVS